MQDLKPMIKMANHIKMTNDHNDAHQDDDQDDHWSRWPSRSRWPLIKVTTDQNGHDQDHWDDHWFKMTLIKMATDQDGHWSRWPLMKLAFVLSYFWWVYLAILIQNNFQRERWHVGSLGLADDSRCAEIIGWKHNEGTLEQIRPQLFHKVRRQIW